MNKLELIDYVSSETGATKADAGRIIDSVIDGISKELKKGRRVTLIGFGTFTPVKREERVGRNPKTGEPVNIPSKKVVKFKTSLELKNSINKK